MTWIPILEVALMTMAIVMSCMVLLVLVLASLRWLAERHSQAVEATSAIAPAPAWDPALVAVITAAAAAALGTPVAVHRIHLHQAPDRDRWSRAGRMDIMVSHRVGPRR